MASEEACLRALWADVLWTAIGDACGTVAGETLGQGPAVAYQRRAVLWFNSRDFEIVAGFAGVDPVAVRERIEPILALPIPKRKEWYRKAGNITGARGRDGGLPEQDGPPVTIRNRSFASEREAAEHYGVSRNSIVDARREGRLHRVGLASNRRHASRAVEVAEVSLAPVGERAATGRHTGQQPQAGE